MQYVSRLGLVGAVVGVCLSIGSVPGMADPARPQAVSPGSPAVATELADSCPTFSWSGVPGATGYELVVYRVAGSPQLETVLEVVFEVVVPGDARGWTPSASQCPRSGSSYAWAVRARNEEGPGAWSEALLFETAGAPTEDEVRRALRVIRRYTEMVTDGREDVAGEDGVTEPEQRVLDVFREQKLRPGLEAIRRELHREARVADAEDRAPSPQTVTPPASFSLAIDADFDLGGSMFKDGDPFLHSDGSPAYDNTALGRNALISLTPGVPAAFAGRGNAAFGGAALRNTNEGSRNTASGFGALGSNTSGSNNTALGYKALYSNITAYGNSACGSGALYQTTDGINNTALGQNAGGYNSTGSNNIFIGSYGFYGVTESNTLRIGNGTGTGTFQQNRAFISGIRGATSGDATYGFDEPVCTDVYDQLGPCSISSARFKEAVQEMGDTASLVSTLRPVTFRFKPREGQKTKPPLQYGLIAEEVAEVLPALVSYDDEGKPFTVRYSLLAPLLLNELQRQDARLEEQEAVVEEQRVELEELRRQISDRDRDLADLGRRLDRLAKKKRLRSR